ncbi:MAG: carbonate dehydratase [Chthoniobacteraceae bacterium]|jgi:carbonic anhydrase
MKSLPELFEANRRWAAKVNKERPGFFATLTRQQAPQYMWIGCADSRVPATEIVGLLPGEIFVHRNVANLVIPSDLNCLSAIQFAVDVLKVRHVIVVGHYGCGGVGAALEGHKLGLVDEWIAPIRELRDRHKEALDAIPERSKRNDRLCELNVLEQTLNVCNTPIIRAAWKRSQDVTVHGWIYDIGDGLLRDLGFCASHEVHIPAALSDAEWFRRLTQMEGDY